MKDFNNGFISEPIITTEPNGTLIKFSSGFAIFTATVTDKGGGYHQNGNIRMSENIQLDISNLRLTSVLGVSVSKGDYANNSGVYGSSYDINNVYVTFFRGDQAQFYDASASVVVFGLWR